MTWQAAMAMMHVSMQSERVTALVLVFIAADSPLLLSTADDITRYQWQPAILSANG